MNTTQRTIEDILPTSDEKIYVPNINVRQSIFVLLLKIIAIEIIVSIAEIIFQTTFIFSTGTNVTLVVLLIIAKIVLAIYVIAQWFNEYYLITQKEIIHKKGLFFKDEDRYVLSHIGRIEVDQNILGKIFNYGTVKLFNWIQEKEYRLYLIHDPIKYHNILKGLLPKADAEKKIFREHLIYASDED